MNPAALNEMLAIARRHHEAGNLNLAEPIYRQALEADPRRADAWHGLGLIAFQSGRAAEAETNIARAIGLEPRNAAFYANLGLAQRALGKRDAAFQAYQTALTLEPNFPEALTNLGTLLKDIGRPADAIEPMQRAARLRPSDPWMHHNLGNTHLALGNLPDALAAFDLALRVRPQFPEAANNRGLTLEQMGQLPAALASFQAALAARPGFPDAANNLARLFRQAGKFDDAIAVLRQALQIREQPALVEALANAFQDIGKWNEAVACWRRMIQIAPNLAAPHNSFANALIKLGKLDESIDSARRALELAPDLVAAQNNLGAALVERGDVVESIRAYCETVERSPNWLPAHSNVLLNLNYLPDATPAWLADEHKRWAAQFVAPSSPTVPAANPGGYPESVAGLDRVFRSRFSIGSPQSPASGAAHDRLRIGYVSADFRLHPVAHFFEPVLRCHDRARVEVFCYSHQIVHDRITTRLQAHGDAWRRIDRLTDDAAADLIRADGIDILIDLSGHTGNNRLGVFARKPAPVQITWIGYPNTTGLAAMDYRITDDVADPPGEPNVHSEELLRLPCGFCCYTPLDDIPPSNPLPSLATGRFTWGSMHNLAKLNPATLDLWAAVLAAVPHSRLLYFRNTLHGVALERLTRAFVERGIAGDRLDFRSLARGEIEYLRIYDEIDVCLDALPWSGHTTTCEALWQGVPTLTLLGNRHAGRMSASMLTQMELTSFISSNPAAYVAAARALADDLDSLDRLRIGMRERMLQSPLGDAARFTTALEAALTRLSPAVPRPAP